MVGEHVVDPLGQGLLSVCLVGLPSHSMLRLRGGSPVIDLANPMNGQMMQVSGLPDLADFGALY